MRTSHDVRERFLSEQRFIIRSVDFLKATTSIHGPQTAKLFDVLRRHGFVVDARPSANARGIPKGMNPLDAAMPHIPALDERLRVAEARAEELSLTNEEVERATGDLFYQWLDYFSDTLEP